MHVSKLETLQDLQKYLHSVYGEKNRKQSFEYIYSFASQNCAYLARSVEKKGDPKPYFISSFSWICALGSHLNIDIYESFYKKFPECCPYCLERSCICSITNKTSLRFSNQREAQRERTNIYESNITSQFNASGKHKTISDSAKKMNSIYPSNRILWKVHGSSYHFSRLFEELGEVYEAYCAYKIHGNEYLPAIAEEISDCIAWLLSAWDIHYIDTNFSDAFSDSYAKDCPVCLKSACECKDHYSRNKALHSEQDLSKLLESLTLLSTAIENEVRQVHSAEEALTLIKQATDEFNKAKNITSTTEVKAVVYKNDSLLSRAKNILTGIPELSEKFNNLFTSYENLKNNLPWT